MFLIAVTKRPLGEEFKEQLGNVNQAEFDGQWATIVTDSFLSQFAATEAGFAVTESLLNKPDYHDGLLSEVIYDRNSNSLSVQKPTQSGRPIYYHFNSQGEFFCSTHISLLKKAGVSIAENSSSLPEFFIYRYITPPKTLYKDIDQLTIGGKLKVTIRSGQCHSESEARYQFFSTAADSSSSESIESIVEQTKSNLQHSLNLLSPYADKLGVMLSGGLDSSLLYAISKAELGIGESYSTSYPFENEKSDIEKEYATSAADALGAKHHFFQAHDNNEYLHGFLDAIATAEEPLHHLQSVMVHLMFKRGFAQGKDVIVLGLIADTLFGLGIQYQLNHFNNHKLKYNLLSLAPVYALIQIAAKMTGRGYAFANKVNMSKSIYLKLDDPGHVIYSLGNYGSEDWVCDYLNVDRTDIIRNKYEALKQYEDRSIFDLLSMVDALGDVSFAQAVWSKLAEGSKKMAYYPFNNSKLINDAFSVSWETKLKQRKYILREVARKLQIPEFIITRPKAGFGVSANKWATKGGVFEPFIPLASKYVDEQVIRKLQSADPKKSMTFWNILNYSIWKRLCIDGEPIENLHEELSQAISDQR